MAASRHNEDANISLCGSCQRFGFVSFLESGLLPDKVADRDYWGKNWDLNISEKQANCWFCLELKAVIHRFGLFQEVVPSDGLYQKAARIDEYDLSKGLLMFLDDWMERGIGLMLISYTAGVPLTQAVRDPPAAIGNAINTQHIDDPLCLEHTPLCDAVLSVSEPSFDPQNVDYSLITSWLGICQESHADSCAKAYLPVTATLRLIDCRTKRVILTPARRYIALSYVWGTGTVEDQPPCGYLPDTVPLVIRDAMNVATRLGVPYLWVDRYCIDQTNEAEKYQSIHQMDRIYAGAELTIIAAAGSDPHYGLPGVSARSRNSPHVISIGRHRLIVMPNPRDMILKSKWSTRGWTYQEMLFSRRKLVFTDDQVYFQCQASVYMEKLERSSFPTKFNFLPHLSPTAFPRNGVGDTAGDMNNRLEIYSATTLSLQSDVLGAFQGIFNAFRQPQFRHSYKDVDYSIRHFWGIVFWAPEGRGEQFEHVSFSLGLGWSTSVAERRGRCRDEGNIWPTWSWARLHGRKLYHRFFEGFEDLRNHEQIRIQFIHSSGQCSTIAQYVNQEDGYEHFRPWVDITSWSISGYMKRVEYDEYHAFGDYSAYIDFDDAPNGPIIGIYIGTHTRSDGVPLVSLLLVEEDVSGFYRRVGVLIGNLRSRNSMKKKRVFNRESVRAVTFPWNLDIRFDALEGQWAYRTLRLV